MVGALHAHSAVPMAAVMAACSVTALVLHRLLVSPMLRVETQADGNELDIQVVE
jgi:hypothetical protein